MLKDPVIKNKPMSKQQEQYIPSSFKQPLNFIGVKQFVFQIPGMVEEESIFFTWMVIVSNKIQFF